MKVFNTKKDLEAALNEARSEGKKIGLVPTMGALHAGHASLVKRSVSENDVTVVSVFVNPTQFNDKNDLKNYPRTLDADCELLASLGATYVFAPSVEEVYPEPDTRHFSYPPIDTVMEGPRRPGHFNGVCQIVSKLFYMVNPDRAYFGEKDFQQIAVIRAMVKDLNLPVEFAKSHTVKETHDLVVGALNATKGLEVEYFEIVNGITLQPVSSWDDAAYIVGCITVYCGARPVRLIDNIKYKEE